MPTRPKGDRTLINKQLNEIYRGANLSAGEAVTMKYYVSGEEDFYGTSAYEKLFNYYLTSGEMPYGTAKARDGMPDEWILNKLEGLA